MNSVDRSRGQLRRVARRLGDDFKIVQPAELQVGTDEFAPLVKKREDDSSHGHLGIDELFEPTGIHRECDQVSAFNPDDKPEVRGALPKLSTLNDTTHLDLLTIVPP